MPARARANPIPPIPPAAQRETAGSGARGAGDESEEWADGPGAGRMYVAQSGWAGLAA